jgi:hypothetical protein
MRYQKRKRLLVDAKVQGPLVLRVVVYWMACVATIEILNLCWQIATCPEQPTFAAYFLNQDWWSSCVRIAASTLLLVPVIFDTLRFSNRFAGPIYRMQRVLRKVVEDGTVEPVKLRDNDFWHDFAGILNAALSRLASQGKKTPAIYDDRPLEQSAVG